MNEPYPRDMVGYGRNPPQALWPGGARLALQIVVNYEEGGENAILHGDRASETFLSEIIGAAPFVGQRHLSMESIYEYGSRAGFWRMMRLFEARSIPVTVFAVAMAAGRWVFRLGLQEQAIMAFTATFSNTVLLGIPIIYTAFGERGLLPVTLITSFHSIVLLTLATTIIEVGQGHGGRFLHSLPKTLLTLVPRIG